MTNQDQLIRLLEKQGEQAARREDVEELRSRVAAIEESVGALDRTVRNGLTERIRTTAENVQEMRSRLDQIWGRVYSSSVVAVDRRKDGGVGFSINLTKRWAAALGSAPLVGVGALVGVEKLDKVWPYLEKILAALR